jgi:hypothetical protein
MARPATVFLACAAALLCLAPLRPVFAEWYGRGTYYDDNDQVREGGGQLSSRAGAPKAGAIGDSSSSWQRSSGRARACLQGMAGAHATD